MNQILKDIIVFALCGRLLYIETEIELTIIEIICTIGLFLDFYFRDHIEKYLVR